MLNVGLDELWLGVTCLAVLVWLSVKRRDN